ncbi:MAG TPA: hypothetical protein VL325_00135, partial [Pyrinomonadaceae bacterium]|nr:hypothetical protein [Pyrinomonadaceae bacterium]
LAVAVTGFETSEKQLTEEDSVLHFRPHFVAIAATHAWNWQARDFTENKLGAFINDVYGGEVQLESGDKNGGTFYTWTAKDGRKAFAFVQNSLIFFGNDESAIEKCLAVERGESDNILKTRHFAEDAENVLASGFIATDGVSQIANLIGVSTAMSAGENEDIKGFIAQVIPPILRGSIKEVSWTASKSDQGIEDRLTIATDQQASSVFNETLVPGGGDSQAMTQYVPADAFSVTRYDFKVAQIAWRSVLLVAQKYSDPLGARIVGEFSGGLFAPYGIANPELFLSGVSSNIVTAKIDAEGEKPVVIAAIRDIEKVKKSLVADLKPQKEAPNTWKSEDGELTAVVADNLIVTGESEAVAKALDAKQSGSNISKSDAYKSFMDSKAVAATIGRDEEIAGKIAEVLSDKKSDDAEAATVYLTETRFNKNGIERRTVSDFGLIGWIIEQFQDNQ